MSPAGDDTKMKRRDFLIGAAALAAGCRQRVGSEPGVEPPSAAAGGPRFTTSPASRAPIVAINSHLLLDEDLRLMRELGFTHTRSTLITQLWTDHPTYAISVRENTQRTQDYGIALLYVVHNVYGEVFNLRNDPAEARRFTGIVGDMMRTLPTVESWQLWNEVDMWVQAPFGSGNTPRLSAERVGENYGRWWQEAYSILKQIRPDALLVTAGTADHSDGRWRTFLRSMLETGLVADGIAVHAYGPWERSRPMIAETHSLVAGRAPIWVTECGAMPGAHWTPDYHAEAWRSTVEGNERERLAERLYLYALQTDPNDPWHGVRNVDGSPRPTMQWLRARAGGG
jgi:hypothetical protein